MQTARNLLPSYLLSSLSVHKHWLLAVIRRVFVGIIEIKPRKGGDEVKNSAVTSHLIHLLRFHNYPLLLYFFMSVVAKTY